MSSCCLLHTLTIPDWSIILLPATYLDYSRLECHPVACNILWLSQTGVSSCCLLQTSTIKERSVCLFLATYLDYPRLECWLATCRLPATDLDCPRLGCLYLDYPRLESHPFACYRPRLSKKGVSACSLLHTLTIPEWSVGLLPATYPDNPKLECWSATCYRPWLSQTGMSACLLHILTIPDRSVSLSATCLDYPWQECQPVWHTLTIQDWSVSLLSATYLYNPRLECWLATFCIPQLSKTDKNVACYLLHTLTILLLAAFACFVIVVVVVVLLYAVLLWSASSPNEMGPSRSPLYYYYYYYYTLTIPDWSVGLLPATYLDYTRQTEMSACYLLNTLTIPDWSGGLLSAGGGYTTTALCVSWTWQESSHPWPNTSLWCCNDSHSDVNLYTPRHQAIICDSSFQWTWSLQELLKVFMLFDGLANVDQTWGQ